MELHERAIRFNEDKSDIPERFFPRQVIPPKMNIKDALNRLSGHSDPEIAKRALDLISLGIAFSESKVNQKIKLGDTEAIFERYRHRLSVLKEEVFLLLFFNTSFILTSEILLTIGVTSKTLYGAKEIFAYAMEQRAAFVVLMHNHPSGNKLPSERDVLATHHLVQVGEFLDITIADHIIITEDDFYSFDSMRMLQPTQAHRKMYKDLFSF